MYRRIWVAIVAVAFAGVLAACGGATSQPAAEAPTTAPAADAPTAAPAAGATAGGARTFTIVPQQTEASYEVQEKFLNRPLPNMAIGKTNAVSGDLQVSLDGKPSGKITKITVDLRTLTSDSSRRDGRIRTQWLESDKYPFAEFTSTDAQGTPDTYTEGQEVSFTLTGDMKIRDVTKPVTFDVKGKLDGDTITGSATSKILMRDFGFDPPDVAGMLSVEDGVTVTINFTAKEAK